jgi:hypothetical protein
MKKHKPELDKQERMLTDFGKLTPTQRGWLLYIYITPGYAQHIGTEYFGNKTQSINNDASTVLEQLKFVTKEKQGRTKTLNLTADTRNFIQWLLDLDDKTK